MTDRLPTRAAAALCVLTLALAACGSREDRIESGLAKATAYVGQGDWDKAQVEVRNVLQIDPRSAQGYLLAARVSEGQGELRRAFGQYLKAAELAPELHAARLGQARLLLLGGDSAPAQALVDAVLTADARNATARTLRAALLARAGRTDAAMALAREVLAESRTPDAEASLLLAGLHANERQWPQALAVIDAALQADPRHVGLLRAAVDLAAANPQDAALSAKATGYYRRATNEAPRNFELWLAWSRWHAARQENDLAESVLRDAVKAQPDDVRRTLALMDFLQRVRGPGVAEKAYLAAIEDRPREMALRFGLASLYRATQRPADAQTVLAGIIDRSQDTPSTVAAQGQLAALRLAAGDAAGAGSLLAEVLKANPRDSAALLLRGRLHLQQGRAADAVADLRGALRDQPGSTDIVPLLAQAHRAAGEPRLARDVLAEALKSRPSDEATRVLLAADLADAGELKAALEEIDAGIRLQPRSVRLHEFKSQLALAGKDTALAQKTLEQLKAQRPREVVAYLRLGQFFTRLKRHDAALREYDAALAAVPGDAAPLVAAVGLLGGLQRFDEARARIDAYFKGSPERPVLRHQIEGELALARRDLGAAEAAFAAIVKATPGASNGYLGLAKVMGARGNAEAALARLAEGEKAVPGDVSLPLTRAEWLTRLRRHDEAIALYEALHARRPDDDTVVNNLAYLLAETRHDQASAERALRLAGRFAASRNPGHLDSLGWIHYRLGQYDKAVPLLEKAIALSPRSPLLDLHLGQALVKSGDTARGRVHLQRAVDSKAELPRLDEARALLAQG